MCRNSPYSLAPGSGKLTSWSTRGLFVTIPVPLGRKSLPTTASKTELFPELCKKTVIVVQRCSQAPESKDSYLKSIDSREGITEWAGAEWTSTCPPITTILGSSDHKLGRLLSLPALSPNVVAALCNLFINATTPSMFAFTGRSRRLSEAPQPCFPLISCECCFKSGSSD